MARNASGQYVPAGSSPRCCRQHGVECTPDRLCCYSCTEATHPGHTDMSVCVHLHRQVAETHRFLTQPAQPVRDVWWW